MNSLIPNWSLFIAPPTGADFVILIFVMVTLGWMFYRILKLEEYIRKHDK